jgi:phage terminase large subunit GpA-like protein
MGVASGAWAVKRQNYREKSVDVAGYDELAAFDDDIEQEGSPTFLGDKRIEGSVWPKSIRGSTPKVRGTCQIERAASESPHFMRFHVACPHCGEEQYLKFGDKETPFGLKWTPDDPPACFISASIMPASSASRSWTLLMPVISAKRPGSGPVMAFSGFRHPVKRLSHLTV